MPRKVPVREKAEVAVTCLGLRDRAWGTDAGWGIRLACLEAKQDAAWVVKQGAGRCLGRPDQYRVHRATKADGTGRTADLVTCNVGRREDRPEGHVQQFRGPVDP